MCVSIVSVQCYVTNHGFQQQMFAFPPNSKLYRPASVQRNKNYLPGSRQPTSGARGWHGELVSCSQWGGTEGWSGGDFNGAYDDMNPQCNAHPMVQLFGDMNLCPLTLAHGREHHKHPVLPTNSITISIL